MKSELSIDGNNGNNNLSLEIDLKKISKQPKEFKLLKDKIEFYCSLEKSRELILLKGKILGELEMTCDRCGDTFINKLNDDIILKISDGIYKSEDLDDIVIETYNSKITLDEILESEIEAINSDYHYCENCENKEDIIQEF
jgi:uncharacterized metal-binding protein YceD (DUF177 family)